MLFCRSSTSVCRESKKQFKNLIHGVSLPQIEISLSHIIPYRDLTTFLTTFVVTVATTIYYSHFCYSVHQSLHHFGLVKSFSLRSTRILYSLRAFFRTNSLCKMQTKEKNLFLNNLNCKSNVIVYHIILWTRAQCWPAGRWPTKNWIKRIFHFTFKTENPEYQYSTYND